METLPTGRSSLYPREHLLELLDDLPQDRDRQLYREQNVVGGRQMQNCSGSPAKCPQWQGYATGGGEVHPGHGSAGGWEQRDPRTLLSRELGR